MPTTYTTILKLALPATGELSGTWGTTVNNNITQMVEEAVTGLASISTWTSNAHTLTTADGTTSEARCVMLDLTGTLTATGTLTLPTTSPVTFKKVYIVRNGTTGGYAVNVGMASGTTATVPNGATMEIYCDGTNTKAVSASITSGYEVNLTATADTTVTLPTTGTLATLAGTETLTNKTLTSPALGTPGSGDFSTGTFTWPTFNQNTSGSAASLSATLAVASGGTGVTTSTGTGSVVLSNSPTLVTPALGTPASGNLANCTFPTLNQSTTGSAASVSGSSSNGYGTRTVSTSAPSGGSDGDVWYRVS